MDDGAATTTTTSGASPDASPDAGAWPPHAPRKLPLSSSAARSSHDASFVSPSSTSLVASSRFVASVYERAETSVLVLEPEVRAYSVVSLKSSSLFCTLTKACMCLQPSSLYATFSRIFFADLSLRTWPKLPPSSE